MGSEMCIRDRLNVSTCDRAKESFFSGSCLMHSYIYVVCYQFGCNAYLVVEGPFVYLSMHGRTVNASRGFFASVWQEYSLADSRWGVADPGIVAVELLTVVVKGPLALYTSWLVLKDNAKYHIWLCFLCLAELYGDYMTFVPEFFTNAAALDTQNPLHLWFYLVISNCLLYTSPSPRDS